MVLVVGNHLKDVNGTTLRLRGASKSGLEYLHLDLDAWTLDMIKLDVSKMRAWGLNTVRLPLRDVHWLSDPRYRSVVDDFVKEALHREMLVIIDLHTQQLEYGMAEFMYRLDGKKDAKAFWISMVETYGNHSSIMFEVFNEPHGISPTTWWYGNSKYYGYQELLFEIRNRSQTVCIVGGLDYAYQWAFLHDYPDILAELLTTSNITVSSHPYGYRGGPDKDRIHTLEIEHNVRIPSNSERTMGDCHLGVSIPLTTEFGFFESFGFMDQFFPVIITEWGLDKPETALQGGWYNNAVVSFMEERNMSFIAWAWVQERLDYPSLLGSDLSPTGLALLPTPGPSCGTVDNGFYQGPGKLVYDLLAPTRALPNSTSSLLLLGQLHAFHFFGRLTNFFVSAAFKFLLG